MTWAPPPAEPFATAAARDAAPPADRDVDALAGPRRADRPGRDPGRRRTPRRCWSRSATRSSRPTRRGRSPSCRRSSPRSSARRSRTQIRAGRDDRRARADGRGHGAAELGAVLPVQGHRLGRRAAGRVPAARRRPRADPVGRAVRRAADARAGRGAGRRSATIDPLDATTRWARFTRSGAFTPYTAPCNISGQPAISVPLYQRDDGLPLAVQLIGQPAGEGALLALAAQLEEAHGWAERRPDL